MLEPSSDWLYLVKIDSPTKGKGVHIHHDVERSLETVRFYVEQGTPVRVERMPAAITEGDAG